LDYSFDFELMQNLHLMVVLLVVVVGSVKEESILILDALWMSAIGVILFNLGSHDLWR